MNRLEQSFQQTVVQFIDRAAPGLLFFHVPNSSGNRGARLGGIMKSMGLRAGVPDLVFVLPNAKIGFLELKAGKGSLSKSQREFRDEAQERGCPWAEARTLTEVWDALEAWLRPWGWTLKVQRP